MAHSLADLITQLQGDAARVAKERDHRMPRNSGHRSTSTYVPAEYPLGTNAHHASLLYEELHGGGNY